MKLTVPVAILTLLISSIISFFGYVTVKTLNDINDNISELGSKIENLTDVRYNHETRLRLLEESYQNKK